MENRKLRACGGVAALCLVAALAACGGGGGSGGTPASAAGGTNSTNGTPNTPLTPGNPGTISSGTPGTPGTVTLADVGSYPARPVLVSDGSGSGSANNGTGGTGGTTGGGTTTGGTTTGGTGTGSGGTTTGSTAGLPTLPPYVPTGPKTLVLYDAPAGDEFQKLGFSYAIMLRNLLGHFDAQVDLEAVQDYTAGQIEAHQATFYLGTAWENPLPAAFLKEAAATAKPLVWFKYNIWKLTDDTTLQFSATHGFSFSALRGMNAAPTASAPSPGFFDTVVYKNLDFVKYYAYDAQKNAINSDPDIGVVTITDTAKASVVVPIRNPKTNEQVPYVTRAGNFWYVADMPFSYIGPRDRYLVIADLLHDMLGIQHAESHRAMVRLEDVGALVNVNSMKRLTDFLQGRGIPFSVAVIPHHMDPLGVANNDGVPQEIPFKNATNLHTVMDYALARGGEIVMHGFTHQYAAMRNPWTAMSGDDYEFWDIVHNTPVAEDSTRWAFDRVVAGLWELTQFHYGPVAWETPHYVSSPLTSRAFPLAFNTTYQRAVYFTADKPDFSAHPGKDFMAGQIYPYIIARDYYGQRVLPENLGNIEYDISRIDPTSNLTYTRDDILLNAKYALAVRDGFASFFFHPFWLERDVQVPQAYSDFTSLVVDITNLGFTWVSPSMLKQQ